MDDASLKAVGADRSEVADILTRNGYRLYRPDSYAHWHDAGRYPGYGPDIFAMRPEGISTDRVVPSVNRQPIAKF
jgi:hypothetical protein